MANDITVSSLNPLSKINIDMGAIGNVFMIIFIAVLILGLIGFLVWLFIQKKKWWIRVPLYKMIGNVNTRIATLKGKVVPMGRAGDHLWFVKGAGLKKYLPPAEIQSAENEFWHFVRSDNEWVNFSMEDIDDLQKKAGVKYVKTDMRLQRLATDKLLEQRHLKIGFLEKWGVVIGFVVFFLIIAISLVVFFNQYSKVVEQLGSVIDKADQIMTKAAKVSGNQGTADLIPAFIPFIIFSLKKKNWRMKWKQLISG